MGSSVRGRDESSERRPVVGRYVLGGVLGRGGASTVYSARDTLLGREVAVKLFTARAGTSEELQRQEAEARLSARLDHFALTTLLDAGVETPADGLPQVYLVMERVPGMDLRERLRQGPLSAMQVAYLGFDIAEALQHVHEHGYLHRDIKPANILLDDRGADTRLRAKLTDFGISSTVGTDQGEHTTGTAAYLGPEQVKGLDATRATDVYALGLVLLEALTGAVAFPGGIEESAFARLERDPVIPSWVPVNLATVLRSMTRQVPGERPGLPEVALALQNSLIGELVRQRALDPALLASDEVQRVAAVRRYDVLEDAPDATFDHVAHLAARLLHTSAAFVSIVDVDRKIIRSSVGLGSAPHEIARNEALCAIPVATGRPVSIPDVLVDPRLAHNPIVAGDAGFRSYAAAPLRTYDGHSLGAVSVLDSAIRDYSSDELDDLSRLAALLMHDLELRHASRRALFEH